MNLDTLIGKLVRYFNQDFLQFQGTHEHKPLPAADETSPYLLYLHIPYCHVLCPFCSFHRVQFKGSSAGRYFDSLRDEIALVSDSGYRFDELYIGGGTPTVLPDQLLETIAFVKQRHPIQGISVETNPDDLGKGGLEVLADAGVTRLSVGVQSFDDDLLREMQRYEKYGSGDEIREALTRAAGCVDTLNVDMIFNFPHQTIDSLARDVDILANELVVDQVSFYPLMVVEGEKRLLTEAMGEVEYSRERRFYELISERMLAAGYTRNSSWCFSRKDGMFDEYIVNREEYLGLGSGAFSYIDGSLYSSTFSIGEYRRFVAEGRTGTVFRQSLDRRDQMRYYLLMQLLGGRLDKRQAERRFGGRFNAGLWKELAGLSVLGAVRDRGEYLELTERGHYLWVVIMREFFAGVNRLRDKMRHSLPPAVAAAMTRE